MTLKDLALDKQLVADLQKFFEAHLEKLAIEKVFAKEDTNGIADAKETIDNAFKQLDIDFNPKPNKINQDNAR